MLVEFLAELFPRARLLPADPVSRAHARRFVALFDAQYPPAFRAFFFSGGPAAGFLDMLAALQARMHPARAGPALGGETEGEEEGEEEGEWSAWGFADLAVAPFLVRVPMLLENEFGTFPLGEGRKALEELRGPRFERLMAYIERARAWPMFQKTYDEVRSFLSPRYGTEYGVCAGVYG